jgi:hypothetical protein
MMPQLGQDLSARSTAGVDLKLRRRQPWRSAKTDKLLSLPRLHGLRAPQTPVYRPLQRIALFDGDPSTVSS